MEALVNLMAQALVDNPEKVSVTTIDSNQTTILELRVAKEDVGKVIGKQGRTANAFRTILNAVGAKNRKHIVFEIIDYGDKQFQSLPRAPILGRHDRPKAAGSA